MGYLANQTQQAYYNGDDHGNYQFTSLNDIIKQFMFVYVGEDKIIPKVKRIDVAFHAQRAMQELSFDTFKSCKAREIVVPASLKMILPRDYVNYTKVSWVDNSGIKHLLYPTSKTSNPSILDDGDSAKTVSATITNGSTNIVLDGIHHGISVGTVLSGPSIGTFVVSNNVISDSNVVLTLADSLGQNTYTPTITITETLTINQSDLFLTTTDVRTPVITGAPWVIGDSVITFDNTADTAGIEIGMIINEFPAFPQNSTVIGVNGKYVTMSTPPTTSPSSASSILFTSLPLEESTNSTAWKNYKSATPSENQDDYQDDTYWPMDGSRFGLDPQHAQANGSFYIDCISGKIHFSSNVAGKTVILDYISDSLGTNAEMQVHKFAEEAMYKWISHAVLASKANTPEYLVARYKKERFAAIRTAKLRLSNIKLEEITQILRGKSKQIKH